MALKEYRITKYDPQLRDSEGAFKGDEWACFSEVGRKRGSAVLSLNEYEAIESAYLTTAIDFIMTSGGSELVAVDLEIHAENVLVFESGKPLAGAQLRKAMKSVLRNECWARFVDLDGRFVHFGYDYYMYVGITVECIESEMAALACGLFVEPFKSPYGEPM